jgi:hypothetical protein
MTPIPARPAIAAAIHKITEFHPYIGIDGGACWPG